MSVWVVVGGQYGSEGKGKIAAHITAQEEIDVCVRCGGPNSGHSFVDTEGKTQLVRQVPTGFIRPETKLMIPAGALVDLSVLEDEMARLKMPLSRIGIDRNAMIIEERDRENERTASLRERLSSTLCGVGSAVARRALRADDVRLAKDMTSAVSWLSGVLCDVSEYINKAVDKGKKILVEGTQGFGLSLYHTAEYPKATSRDTTAAGFLSEVGLSPLLVNEIVIVFRTFPIRVAGSQAGTLFQEISWEQLQLESGYPDPVVEYTSVTNKRRRIGRFDWELALRAVRTNRPTRIAINGLDYLCHADRKCSSEIELSPVSQNFIGELEGRLSVPVGYLGVGPSLCDIAFRGAVGTSVGKFGTSLREVDENVRA